MLPKNKEANKMMNTIKDLIREAMSGSENLNAEEPEPGKFFGQPLEGQELLDALASDISDMYKDINGIRPRWIKFSEMSLEELEQLHDQTSAAHEAHWNEDRVQQDLDDLGRENSAMAQQMVDDEEAASYQADRDEEEKTMLSPEEGEDQPKRMGMGRRPLVGPARDVRRGRRISETRVRRDTANKLYNLLIMEQEYGIITPQELAELKAAINKVLGVSVGNLL
jgi:hypothetical protein